MGSRWKHASVLAKLASSFAILGVVSFGLCGINFAFPDRGSEFGWTGFGVFGFFGLVLSFLGLVLVGIVFIVKLAVDRVSGGDQPIRISDSQGSSLPPDEIENDKDKL